MEKLKVAFMGSPDFAVPCLQALVACPLVEVKLVVTQPDKPAGRGQKLMPPPVKTCALAAGLPILQPVKIKNPPLAEALRPLGLDLVIVVAYGRILPPDLLAVPRLGCWNVHGSLLPKYRGAAPIQWSVLDGEKVTGVTLMQMEEGLDTGPMLLKRELPIADDDTSGTVFAKLAPLGAAVLVEGIERQVRGELVAEKQDDTRATKAPMLDKEQGRVDWSKAAAKVRDWIRGMDPWPGAFTTLDGEVLKLWRPRVVKGATGLPPGTVLVADRNGLVVACGDEAVLVEEGQLPGRKRMPFGALVGGRPIPIGAMLGAPQGTPVNDGDGDGNGA